MHFLFFFGSGRSPTMFRPYQGNGTRVMMLVNYVDGTLRYSCFFNSHRVFLQRLGFLKYVRLVASLTLYLPCHIFCSLMDSTSSLVDAFGYYPSLLVWKAYFERVSLQRFFSIQFLTNDHKVCGFTFYSPLLERLFRLLFLQDVSYDWFSPII